MDIVKSAFCTNITKKWIQERKFCYCLLADRILKLYLKQTDPTIPTVINIAPRLSKEEFVDIAYAKHMTPLFNEWRPSSTLANNIKFKKMRAMMSVSGTGT